MFVSNELLIKFINKCICSELLKENKIVKNGHYYKDNLRSICRFYQDKDIVLVNFYTLDVCLVQSYEIQNVQACPNHSLAIDAIYFYLSNIVQRF